MKKPVYFLALSLALLACQVSPVINNATNTTSKSNGVSAKDGTVAAKFDLGQTINSNDFLKRPLKTQGFKIKQASTSFSLSDIEKAVLTVVSAQIPEPATASLNRTEIASGWFNEFSGIPAGPATVTLEVFNVANQRLFKDQREVQVQGGAVTPVDFTITTDCGSNCNQDNITGSIAVSVRAITSCFAQLQVSPGLVDLNQAVSVSLAQTSGNITQMDLSYGDGQGASGSSLGFPLSHAYASEGRYPVALTVSGPSCINPYTATSYVSVSRGDEKGTPPSASNLIVATTNPDTGQSDIYHLQNGVLKAITNDNAWDAFPSRTANSNTIAFLSSGRDNQSLDRIYLMDKDGGNIRRATNTPDDPDIGEWNPDISADGAEVVLGRWKRDGNGGYSETSQIYLHKADGSQVKLTDNLAWNWGPRFSPLGQFISFTSSMAGPYQLYLMQKDGTNQRPLTFGFDFVGPHSWSPDGTRLIFSGARQNNDTNETGLFTIKSDGTDLQFIYSVQVHQDSPEWPRWLAGDQIVFTSYPTSGENPKIISVRPDGTSRQILLELPANFWAPGIASNRPNQQTPLKDRLFKLP